VPVGTCVVHAAFASDHNAQFASACRKLVDSSAKTGPAPSTPASARAPPKGPAQPPRVRTADTRTPPAPPPLAVRKPLKAQTVRRTDSVCGAYVCPCVFANVMEERRVCACVVRVLQVTSAEGIEQNPTGKHNGRRVWAGGIVLYSTRQAHRWQPWDIDMLLHTRGEQFNPLIHTMCQEQMRKRPHPAAASRSVPRPVPRPGPGPVVSGKSPGASRNPFVPAPAPAALHAKVSRASSCATSKLGATPPADAALAAHKERLRARMRRKQHVGM